MASHTFFCIDGHTCGNPVRVVAGGAPALAGSTMLEKRAHFLAEFDWIRHALMFEPRGHDMMSGAILYPPTRADCDAAILFIETSGCLPMCGHGTIGTVTTMIERGLVTPATPGRLNLDTPAGPVAAEYEQKGPFVEWVRLTNVPSYLHASGLEADVDGIGRLRIDVAYGGNFYAIIDPQESFKGLEHIQPSQVLQWSPLVRKVFGEKFAIPAPGEAGDRRPLARDVDGQAAQPSRLRAQRSLLRRQGDRPLSVRDRHECAHGAVGRHGQA